MKISKKKIAALFVLMISLPVVAQEDVNQFLKAGLDDAHVLSKAYLRPYGEMLGKSLNGGWYNSAKVHRVGGFDLTVSVMGSFTPSSGKSFDVGELGLKTFELAPGSSEIAPNMAGEFAEGDIPILQPKTQGGEYAEFKLPNGAGLDKMPIPTVQAAVGLPFHTEVMARFVPKMDFGDDGRINLIGFGLKHSLKDYIPFVKRVPFLQLSALMGYTSFNSAIAVDGGSSDNELLVSSKALTSRLLVGANFPVICFYTGVGYGSTQSDFDLKGQYDFPGSAQGVPDPISLSYKNTGLDFNVGMRLRLGFLALHGDYTVGEYSTITAGVGINIR